MLAKMPAEKITLAGTCASAINGLYKYTLDAENDDTSQL
jgi:hypothetical protein